MSCLQVSIDEASYEVVVEIGTSHSYPGLPCKVLHLPIVYTVPANVASCALMDAARQRTFPRPISDNVQSWCLPKHLQSSVSCKMTLSDCLTSHM